jgi:hypothetical protein
MDTAESLGQGDVRREILAPVGSGRPLRVLQKNLTAQFVSDAKPLGRTQASDALGPVTILCRPHGGPVPRDELANPACHHLLIVPRRRVWSADVVYRASAFTPAGTAAIKSCRAWAAAWVSRLLRGNSSRGERTITRHNLVGL